MRVRTRLALGAVIAALLAGAGPAAQASVPAVSASDGWVRCANLSPGNPGVDIYLLPFGNTSDQTVLKHVSYGDVSSYMPVSSGQYTVAMRPVGAPASSYPVVSANFMVAAGTNYTVASLGPASARRVEVLQDQTAAPKGQALVRIIQASLKQNQVTVTDGQDVLARDLAFGKVTSYLAVKPGTATVQFTAPGTKATMAETFAAGSVHTIVVLDGSSGLRVDTLTDAAGSAVMPKGGAATGFGGTAPRAPGVPLPWLATLAGGLLLTVAGAGSLRRPRRLSSAAGR